MAQEEQEKRRPILAPVDRVTEAVFGLLMAMTFTGTLSIATAGQEEARTMLIAAFGCNLAWGLADAFMYLLRTWTDRSHNRNLLLRLHSGIGAEQGQALIADALPPRLAEAAQPASLEQLRQGLLARSGPPPRARLGLEDLLGALGTFLLVVLATFPVVIPFLLTDNVPLAVRSSNMVALVMFFLFGWILTRYAGGRPWLGGLVFALLATALILAIIALGG